MRRRVQISFLSAFLTLLTVAFAAALVVRVRAYSGGTATESSESAAAAAGTSAAARSKHAADGTFSDELSSPGATASKRVSPSPNASAAAARAQRFRELLALGAPKVDVPASSAQAPVKIAAPPVAPKVQTPARPNQTASNAFRGSGASGSAGNGGQQSGNKPNTPTNDPKDPNSDTTPPQLISIAFDPPQVTDGGDTTLVVTATDDLSGIRRFRHAYLLFGGTGRSIALQPLSVEGSVGINLSLGVSSLTLSVAQ